MILNEKHVSNICSVYYIVTDWFPHDFCSNISNNVNTPFKYIWMNTYWIYFVRQHKLLMINPFNNIRLELLVFNGTFNNSLAIWRRSAFLTERHIRRKSLICLKSFKKHIVTYCFFDYTGHLTQNFRGDIFCTDFKGIFTIKSSNSNYGMITATTLPTIIYHIQ